MKNFGPHIEKWRSTITDAEATRVGEDVLRAWAACIGDAPPKEPGVEAFLNEKEAHMVFIYMVGALHRMPEDAFKKLVHETQVAYWVRHMAEKYYHEEVFSWRASIWSVWRQLRTRLEGVTT